MVPHPFLCTPVSTALGWPRPGVHFVINEPSPCLAPTRRARTHTALPCRGRPYTRCRSPQESLPCPDLPRHDKPRRAQPQCPVPFPRPPPRIIALPQTCHTPPRTSVLFIPRILALPLSCLATTYPGAHQDAFASRTRHAGCVASARRTRRQYFSVDRFVAPRGPPFQTRAFTSSDPPDAQRFR